MALTRKRRIFIDEYLKCWNASEAARRAGYTLNRSNEAGRQLLANTDILAAIQARLAEVHMSADEALKLLADQARGDIGEIMDVSSVGFNLDMAEAKKRGLTKLIKRVRQTTTTKIGRKQDDDDEERTIIEVELYDAQAALDKILRVHGRFIERQDITTGGEKLQAIGVIAIDYRDGLTDLAPRPVRDSDPPGPDKDAHDGSKMGENDTGGLPGA